MKLTPTQIVATNEQQSASMPSGFRFVDAKLARAIAEELESWMERCRTVENLNDMLRARNITLMDERESMQQQMVGMRREIEHQKARVRAYAESANESSSATRPTGAERKPESYE
jgi:hypothetical protein